MTKARGKNLTSREAASLLGVSEASVKRWADSGLLPALKTAGGHRRFRPEDVARLRRNASAEEGSHVLKRRFSRPLVEALARDFDGEALPADVLRALLAGDSEELSALLILAHLKGLSVAAIGDALLCPAMRNVGDRWHRGELSIAQEHVATRAALSASQTLRTVLGASEPRVLRAVCCSTEDDFHELPVQLAALMLEAGGYEVINLGTSTPFYALAEAVERFQPRIACVASTILTDLDRAAREYEVLRAAAGRAGAQIVLGGAGFADANVRRRFPAELHADSFQQLESFATSLP